VKNKKFGALKKEMGLRKEKRRKNEG